jgi:hypothetical protein
MDVFGIPFGVIVGRVQGNRLTEVGRTDRRSLQNMIGRIPSVGKPIPRQVQFLSLFCDGGRLYISHHAREILKQTALSKF